MPNLTSVGITSGLGSSGTGTISTLDNLIGTAGTASAQVQTVQGIASMTALKVDGSAVTQPVSGTFWQTTQPVSGTVTANVAAGSNIIGKASLVDSGGTDATDTVNHAIKVNIVAGGGTGGTALADEGAFAEGSTNLTPVGGVYKTSHTALTSGQAGAVALTSARQMMTVTNLSDGTGNAIASTAGALNVNISSGVNANGRATSANSAPVVLNKQSYQSVAASASATALSGGGGGATGDWLDGLLIIPATTSPGAVSITDGSGSAMTIFTGGASSVTNLVSFYVPVGAVSTSGAWKVTTGTNVSVFAVGVFF